MHAFTACMVWSSQSLRKKRESCHSEAAISQDVAKKFAMAALTLHCRVLAKDLSHLRKLSNLNHIQQCSNLVTPEAGEEDKPERECKRR